MIEQTAVWLAKAQMLGVGLLIAGWIWWRVLDEALKLFNAKALFLQFCLDYNRKKCGARRGSDA